jgi:hypothetical protein
MPAKKQFTATRSPNSEPPPAVRRFRALEGLSRKLTDPGRLADVILIDNENTQANRIRKRLEEAQADMKENARNLLEAELHRLSYMEKGELAAFLTEIQGDETDEVARALYFDEDTSACRVAKCAAKKAHPCRTPCAGVHGCLHRRGYALWWRIVARVRSKLGAARSTRSKSISIESRPQQADPLPRAIAQSMLRAGASRRNGQTLYELGRAPGRPR